MAYTCFWSFYQARKSSSFRCIERLLSDSVQAPLDRDLFSQPNDISLWNKKGGVMHWTHKDPRNHHTHGWLKHNGKVYE
ncbi:hypothetical protein VCRA2123O444_290028 [Vibrio crassostreae]|nr:hypothetical protein VCRA2119O431_10497 [Vibrio crassostreae]CAK1874817.1 hypothetical protein VCRA2113O409_10497 [Vibrio crassostreae]CAK1884560.1 hypothetical protein VCRA2113O418_10498 [Vibrio crassostreae]CAK1886491.1 hypothetical protein VCRA2113O414_10497 [Vibrio crassostreae]CAK1938652.1 hypothetical protein VCRA2113O416_260032 [Vibrio crassostreae]